MNTDKIFLDVRIHKVNRLIILAKNEIDDPSILVGKSIVLKYGHLSIYFILFVCCVVLVFHEFEITSNEWVNFKFRNNLGSPVNVEDLPELILQKKNSGSFFIELVLEKSPLTFRSEVNSLFCSCVLFSYSLNSLLHFRAFKIISKLSIQVNIKTYLTKPNSWMEHYRKRMKNW